MGFTSSDHSEWLLIYVPGEDAPEVTDGDLHTHNWSSRIIHSEKWLFLNVGFEEKSKNWSFAFDLNSPNALRFLRRMLRTKRVLVGFRNKVSIRLDPNPADSLVEDFGKKLDALMPGWRQAYRP